MANEQLFQERQSRIEKAINFEPVDRIPLIFMGTATVPRQMGLDVSDFVDNPIKIIDAALDYMDRLGVDSANVPIWYRADVGLSALWLSRIKMPGRELPKDTVWQVDEKEIMTVEDYDTIIDQGFEAFMFQHLPKIVDMQIFQEGMAQSEEIVPVMMGKYAERGYPLLTAAPPTTIPFEVLCGGRSMMPFFMDLYRIPDKVKEAMDAILPALIGQAIGMVEKSGVRCVWLGGWRSASALLAPKLWDEFVFPYIVQVVNALVEKNIMPVLHLDQDWTRDLARLRELPAKKCIINPDGMTDMRKTREILGDHMAIMGDVPAELLATGSPDDVYNYVRDFIGDLGKEGLLLCPGCDAPINAKGENMQAMYDAGREFG